MTTLNLKSLPLVAALAAATWSSANAALNDTFDSIDPAWVTDRYEPDAFVSENFLGDNRLRIGISTDDSAANRPGAFIGSFYDTQGRQRAVTGLGSIWAVSADVYVSADMIDDSSLRRTDLSARTGLIGSETGADYPIIGIRQFDPADAYNPAAANIAATWRVWDADAGGWQNLANTITPGWNTLSIIASGASYEFGINGSTVYTDATVNGMNLTTAFLEAFNFGNENYSVHWDNLSVSVPEPATCVLFGIASLGLVGVRRRK